MRIAVIGAGNSGLATAAYFKKYGYFVTLWNRTEKNIANLKQSRRIKVLGIWDTTFIVDIVTSDIKEAIQGVDLILVTTPSDSHKDIARLIAPYVKEESIIILNPGRTFGAIEVKQILLQEANVCPIIGETQTILYTCRKIQEDVVSLLAIKRNVQIAFLSKDGHSIFKHLPKCYSCNLILVDSILITSLGNVGMILHCAPVLFNIGWIENKGVAFKYYYAGITPSIANFLECMDKERIMVANKLGVDVLLVQDWLKKSYKTWGNTLYECLQNNDAYKTIDAPSTLKHRYIMEDVCTGLVPVEYIAHQLGIVVPHISLVIDIAENVVDFPFREKGRKMDILDLK